MDRTEKLLADYENRRVLVTGGASFIGSHLVELLVQHGADVTVADDLSSGRLEHLQSVADSCRILIGDLRDPSFATQATAGQDTVFHLAASHGGRGYIDTHPVECCNNILLDHVVFQSAATAEVERVVYASSACVYPTNLQEASGRGLLREDQCNFEEPGKAFADGEYGWAKLASELQLRAFHKQYGLTGIACRIFTAYGERENESHAVIALIAKAFAGLDPYPIWGDGSQTRNFTYVGDTVKGLALAGATTVDGFDVINIGSPSHTTIDELIAHIFEATGFLPSRIDRQLDKPVGVRSRAADCTKSDAMWDWHPVTPIDVGVRQTVEWYRASATAERLAVLDSLLMTR